MRVLLLAPTFFGYRTRVAEEMVAMGHEVEVVDDRPSESTVFRSLAKISYGLVGAQIENYAHHIATLIADGAYDRVVYMGGMSFCFTPEQFKVIRRASGAQFTAYLWDSFINCQRFSACIDMFDEIYSFEPTDCEKYGLHFRPLFYNKEYAGVLPEPNSGFEYDACFIGSVHQPSKFEAVLGICSGLEQMEMNVYKHFYMPSRSVQALRKMTRPAYRSVSFTGDSLSPEMVASIYERSKAVIDSPQSGQTGLTMRTLEVLGSRRKLITTNRDIVNYDFYDPSNVFVSIGGSVPSISFFEGNFIPFTEDVAERYSIRRFCKVLIGQKGHETGYRKATS